MSLSKEFVSQRKFSYYRSVKYVVESQEKMIFTQCVKRNMELTS